MKKILIILVTILLSNLPNSYADKFEKKMSKINNSELKSIKKIVRKIPIYIRLTPDTKTVAIQLLVNNIDCPKSG